MSACRSCFRPNIFVSAKIPALFDLAQPIPGPVTTRLATLAKQLRIVLVASLFEKRAPGVYHNTAVIFDADGSLRGLYRKMHIPDDPLYYEKYYFTPGDLGYRAFDTGVGRIGTLVCWDQWYPEGARLTALQGAELIFLSHRDRLASLGESRVRRVATRRLAHHSARSCHRQWSIRGRGKSRGP